MRNIHGLTKTTPTLIIYIVYFQIIISKQLLVGVAFEGQITLCSTVLFMEF